MPITNNSPTDPYDVNPFLLNPLNLQGTPITSAGSGSGAALEAGAGLTLANAAPLIGAVAQVGQLFAGKQRERTNRRVARRTQANYSAFLSDYSPDLISVPDLPRVDVGQAVQESTQSLLDGIAPASEAARQFNEFYRDEIEASVPGLFDAFRLAAERSQEFLSEELTDLDAGPSDLRRRIVAEVSAAAQPQGGALFNDRFITSLADTTLQENLSRRASQLNVIQVGQGLAQAGQNFAQSTTTRGEAFLPYTSVTAGQTIDLAFRQNMAQFQAELNAEIANSGTLNELSLAQGQANATTAGQRSPANERRRKPNTAPEFT